MKIVRVLYLACVFLGGVYWAIHLSAVEPPALPGTVAPTTHQVLFSPDSKLLVVHATGDNSLSGLNVYDVQSRAVIQSLSLPRGGGRSFNCSDLSFSGDGRWLAAAGHLGPSDEFFVWDTANWERKSFSLPDKEIRGIQAIALSRDGSRLAASCGVRDDQTVFLFDREGKLILRFAISGSCRSLRFVDGDKSLVCAVQTPIKKDKEIDALCVQTWSLAGPRKTAERENLLLWDLPRLRALAHDGAGVGVNKFVLSPDGSAIAASTWRDISAFSLASARGGNLGVHDLNCTALAISADNNVLASGGHWSGGIWLWDLSSGRRQQKLMFTPQPPDMATGIDPTWERGTCCGIALSPDGQYAAATTANGGKDNSIFLWKIEP
jgi:WD40 repeat protein